MNGCTCDVNRGLFGHPVDIDIVLFVGTQTGTVNRCRFRPLRACSKQGRCETPHAPLAAAGDPDEKHGEEKRPEDDACSHCAPPASASIFNFANTTST